MNRSPGRRSGIALRWVVAGMALGLFHGGLLGAAAADSGSGPAGGQAASPAPEDAWLTAPALHGMTGLINTPTAYTIPSGGLRIGFGWYDEEWAYDPRLSAPEEPRSDNYQYFLTFGFVSRVEVSVRASYSPEGALRGSGPDEKGTVDRGGNARVQVFTEGRHRPAIAVGIDDIRGTRRFHALYAVGSKSFSASSGWFRFRASAGYGSDALDAKGHILKGFFGGGEACLGRYGSIVVDYDTEKWNTGIRLFMFRHLTAYAALLHFDAPAGGLSWTHQF